MSIVGFLQIGQEYDRPELARLWGLRGMQALSRGVYTPAGQNTIILFVTRKKQGCLTQYNDFLDGDLLFWEGEKGHGSDERIATASARGEEIHLFYRKRHHSPFVYHGRTILTHWIRQSAKPSEFVFKVASLAVDVSNMVDGVAAPDDEYRFLTDQELSGIDREIVARSRGIAQRVFRGNLLRLWDGSCAVTGVREASVLKAGHIKPWAAAQTGEKLDHFNGLLLVPNLDSLFEEGLISFRNNGSILVSDHWDREDQQRMHITGDLRLRQVFPESRPYLEYHRDMRFQA
jgi:hypothetical protein